MSSLPSIRVDVLTAAGARKRLLRDVVCSIYWLDQIVIPADGQDGQSDVWLICQDAYPPHNDGRSQMQVCSVCNHICPSNIFTDELCCDCLVELKQEAMAKMIADPANRDIVRDLLRLSRLPIFSYSLFQKTHSLDALGVCIEEGEGASDGDARWWAVLDSRLHSDNASPTSPSKTKSSKAKSSEAKPPKNKPSETKPPRHYLRSPRAMTDHVHEFLSKRAGSGASLLPEKKCELKKEITYFKKNGTIMPRASKAFFRVSMRR